MELVVRPAPALWLFLPPRRRRTQITVPYDGSASLGHVVQSLGIPLTEVGPPSVDGAAAGASRPLHQGAVVGLDPPPRPQPLPHGARFLLDVHLGTLARRLRVLGVDTSYDNDADDPDLVARAGREQRVLLTQDRGLLMRRALWAGAYVRGHGATAQLADVLDRFAPPLRPRTRCAACNGELVDVPKEQVVDLLEPGTRRRYERFARCRSCGRVYWHGAHGRRLDALVADAVRAVGAAGGGP
ncbi:Mut7-C ubiquitin/RNAse domain-containing protein [Pseudonocardia kunmingensis]|uniref:Mut7-C ubiquitin/RNAse domain-containing protein n=1 Tax=Pseudonocardia kunmingensis TaxID=630975 RepID=UPI001FE481BC|nr:Mut7-C ubiquitin/RNAse domain-containing protein [Pseudonocardia kunmingensis]